MSREYPRYAGKIQLSDKDRRKGLLCACCDQTACGYADIQNSWSRSEDEAHPVCEEHRKLARENVSELLALLPKHPQHLHVESEKS